MLKTPSDRIGTMRFLDCRQRVIVAGRPATKLGRPIAFAEVDHSERDLPAIVVPTTSDGCALAMAPQRDQDGDRRSGGGRPRPARPDASEKTQGPSPRVPIRG